jgi:hypothetical protein
MPIKLLAQHFTYCSKSTFIRLDALHQVKFNPALTLISAILMTAENKKRKSSVFNRIATTVDAMNIK